MTKATEQGESSAKAAGIKYVTLRMPPDLHERVTKMAGSLQHTRGQQVSINTLILELIGDGLDRLNAELNK
jgi:predicted HicB family RNase H-like nuclease